MHTGMRRLLFTVPALLAFAISAQAQKPALTKSVDEPGRNPYQDFQTLSCSGGFLTICGVTFKPVPAGYRLVVTHVSLRYTVSTAALTSGRLAYMVESSDGVAEFLPAPGLVYSGATAQTPTSSAPRSPSTLSRAHSEHQHGQRHRGRARFHRGYLVAIP